MITLKSQRFLLLFLSSLLLASFAILFLPRPLANNLISSEKAAELVKALPEVQAFLQETGGHVTAQTGSPNEAVYLVQVYEVKDNHTATFNWYYVNKKDGSIKKEF